eukprot:TRINITY_DN1544_c0_g1_i1.p1 TRINITY_DN1544_c0_g1~~TRINITY_DN1544_c0_g1_i1.p1  ORF type:complete len:1441 (-),score=400.02 TRINITY_DN1544_c0_g1_i1:104-4426(-)
MLALEEKNRCVILLMPELILETKADEIVNKFEEAYLEVKARKEIFLSDAEAASYFHYLEPEARQAAIASAGRGLCEVLVLEHLDGDVVERCLAMVEGLEEVYGKGSFYLSVSLWECRRDIEFFFPHLDSLPVERTLAVLKPSAIEMGEMNGKTIQKLVEDEAAALGLFVVGTRTLVPNAEQAALLCSEYEAPSRSAAMEELSGKQCVAMCLEGRGSIGKLQLICGPLSTETAKARAPSTIRALWGNSTPINAIHASVDMAQADKELQCLFPEGTLKLQRTLCIVKPDSITNLVAIKTEIEAAGFTVLREKQTCLTEERAKEFYRDYQEKPSFNALVKEAISGPCCAMVLCRLEAIAVWNQLMGDASVKVARKTSPGSIRARFGRDGQRNAVHGSENQKAALREIRFFFPDMGVDPIPGEGEVKDFLFRKSSRESMDLKCLSDAEATDFTADPTMQQLLSDGLIGLCQVKPKGLGAVEWLASWLRQHNPNMFPAQKPIFDPPERTKVFKDYGINEDGMAFVVEAPRDATAAKPVVAMDAAEMMNEGALADLGTPPFVVLMVGAAGQETVCSKIAEDFNVVHLNMQELISVADLEPSAVTDDVLLNLLKKAMMKHQDTNRFLVSGFPMSLEQAQRFEREIAEVSFVLHLQGGPQEEHAKPLVDYYEPIGKLRKANAAAEDVYSECKSFFKCRFLYMMGPPGAPVEQMAERLETKYGYSAINFAALLKTYSESGEPDSNAVKKALSVGKAVDASIACPLVLSEIYRDMALGVQNFVLIDFPQSLKQVQFLEYKIPCFSKALVLDFNRADATDLAALACSKGANMVEMEMKASAFFGNDTKAMLQSMADVQRIPCSVSEMECSQPAELGFEGQVAEGTWKNLLPKVMPSIAVVLGLPNSGTQLLAPLLAANMTNVQAVDCNQLLDKELERQTEMGLTMHNMLAKGQVVPLSTTLELLKGVINLTCSDSLVIENCPLYVDQIELIEQEFRIDKVYYIQGSAQVVNSWRDQYTNQAPDDPDAGKTFSERAERLQPIVAHFSRLGKLEKFEVTETPSQDSLKLMLETASMPQFAVVRSMSSWIAAKEAELLCNAFGLGKSVTIQSLQTWAEKMNMTLDPSQPDQLISALKQFAQSSGLPMLVLENFPNTEQDAQAFMEMFGQPKLLVNLDVDDEFLKDPENPYRPHAEDDIDPEVLDSELEQLRTAMTGATQAFMETYPGCCVSADGKAAQAKPEETLEMIKTKLLPTLYVILCPPGEGFANLVAETICTLSTAKSVDAMPAKYTVLDASAICRSGGHSCELETALMRASSISQMPCKLWADLLKESFANSSNPMGTFLLTNLPTPDSVKSGETIRDLFAMIESVATLGGILHVKPTQDAFVSVCTSDADSFAAYKDFDSKVYDQAQSQFGLSQLMDCAVQTKEPMEAAATVAKAFFTLEAKPASEA